MIVNRRALRQRLGTEFLRDVLASITTGSHGTTGSVMLWDTLQADPTLSGDTLYHRSWVRVMPAGGVASLPTYWDSRVSSFNSQSGVFLLTGTPISTIQSGSRYEIHTKVSPDEKDKAIDAVVRDIRFYQDLAIWTTNDKHIYSLGPEIMDVVHAKYYAQPTDSLNLMPGDLHHFEFISTSTGQHLYIEPSLDQSQQLILKAILTVSLQDADGGDTATINVPTDDWILSGAAVRCYWLMEQNAPGQEAKAYAARRKEMARQYSLLSRRFKPAISRKIQMDAWN